MSQENRSIESPASVSDRESNIKKGPDDLVDDTSAGLARDVESDNTLVGHLAVSKMQIVGMWT